MATDQIQCGLRLKESVYEKVKFLAAQEHRSFNNLVEYAIQNILANMSHKTGQLKLQGKIKIPRPARRRQASLLEGGAPVRTLGRRESVNGGLLQSALRADSSLGEGAFLCS